MTANTLSTQRIKHLWAVHGEHYVCPYEFARAIIAEMNTTAETSDKQEAVAWTTVDALRDMTENNGAWVWKADPSREMEPGDVLLYATPLDKSAAQDNVRYQWLKDKGLAYEHWQNLKRLEDDDEFDAYIDAEIKKERGE
jgi:hypothetical protein